MSIDTAKRPIENETDAGDDDTLVHRFCTCNHKIALCGKAKDEWQDMPEWDPSEMCIVCEHLHMSRKCPKCSGQS